jgi:DMSO/TMAO reductase YedYZ molybdopterin-dependent catalytic subunit
LIDEFPRFGVAEFARRPIKTRDIHIEFFGSLEHTIALTSTELATLPRVQLHSDFHCAAGWSHRGLHWEGLRFKDVWDAFILRHVVNVSDRSLLVLRCQDGFRTSLPLLDLLRRDVLIADRLNDEPLTLDHGAPVRLIAPAHYGYKSAKHLAQVEILADGQTYRPLLPRFMEHPRARVELEERGQFLPGWLLRYLFRPFIKPLIRNVRNAAEANEGRHERRR